MYSENVLPCVTNLCLEKAEAEVMAVGSQPLSWQSDKINYIS